MVLPEMSTLFRENCCFLKMHNINIDTNINSFH